MEEQATNAPVLELLTSMTADSIEASGLDAETLMLVRIAALVAVDAPAVSYLMNLGAAGEAARTTGSGPRRPYGRRPDRRHGAGRLRDGQDRRGARARDRDRRDRRGGRGRVRLGRWRGPFQASA